jgi:hypothetical protein
MRSLPSTTTHVAGLHNMALHADAALRAAPVSLRVRQRTIEVGKMATPSLYIFPEEVCMSHGRPPISTTTRL